MKATRYLEANEGELLIGGAALAGILLLVKGLKGGGGGGSTGTGAVPAVQGISAQQNPDGSWTVSWQAVTVQGQAVTYTVGRSDTNQPVQTTATSITLQGLPPGQVKIALFACTGGTNGMAQTCGQPSLYTINVPAPTMPAVGNITASVSGTSATISWAPVPVPQGMPSTATVTYTIQHTDSSGNPVSTSMGNSPATISGITGTSFTITGLTPGYPLNFTVRACLNY